MDLLQILESLPTTRSSVIQPEFTEEGISVTYLCMRLCVQTHKEENAFLWGKGLFEFRKTTRVGLQSMTGVPGLSMQCEKVTEQHLNLCLHITAVLFAIIRLLFSKVIKIFRRGFVFLFCFYFCLW